MSVTIRHVGHLFNAVVFQKLFLMEIDQEFPLWGNFCFVPGMAQVSDHFHITGNLEKGFCSMFVFRVQLRILK